MTARKTMVLIAYTANKRFSFKALPCGACLDSDLYIDFLKSTGNEWRTLRADAIKLSELYFQQDNARCHVSAKTRQFCERRKMTLIKQSLKEHLRQFSFNTAEKV